MLDEYVTADRELQLAFDSLVVDAVRLAHVRDDENWLKLISRQGEVFVEAAIQKAHDALQEGDFHDAVMALFHGASQLEKLAAGLAHPGALQGSAVRVH